MSYVIIGRNPRSKRLFAVEKEDADRLDVQQIAEFEVEAEAEKTAQHIPIFRAWPYEIVEIEL